MIAGTVSEYQSRGEWETLRLQSIPAFGLATKILRRSAAQKTSSAQEQEAGGDVLRDEEADLKFISENGGRAGCDLRRGSNGTAQAANYPIQLSYNGRLVTIRLDKSAE